MFKPIALMSTLLTALSIIGIFVFAVLSIWEKDDRSLQTSLANMAWLMVLLAVVLGIVSAIFWFLHDEYEK